MPQNISFEDWIARSNKCRRSMTSLVKRFGVETCEWALNVIATEMKSSKHGPGRKVEIPLDRLRDIWVFVEAGRILRKTSVNAFCSQAKFSWYSVGGPKGAQVLKSIKGATLRRRYHDAAARLAAETESWRKSAALHGSLRAEETISPIENWWRSLVKEQVDAALSGNSSAK